MTACSRSPARNFSLRLLSSLVGLILFIQPASFAPKSFASEEKAVASKTGAELYAAMCARCHGNAGQGTEDYSTPLTGDKSQRELAVLIAKTMPEDTDEKCSPEDSAKIAEYMYGEFYSILAQERNRPATIEFSRLTVRQYEQSVGDLVASFRWQSNNFPDRGLKAKYYNLRSFNDKKLVHERVDPGVNFQFGEHKPEGYPTEPDMEKRRPDDIHDDKEFSIRWDGSVFAPETGDYEFILESENGVRLYLNGAPKPVIEAWVHSGDEKEFRFSTRLIGGRYYPIGVHFFRYKEPTSSVVLKWKRPFHTEEVIPERYLSPNPSPGLYVVKTPFPPDDRSIGYERGNSVSKGWQDAVVMSALESSGDIVDFVYGMMGIKQDTAAEEKKKKLDEFCARFVEGAFRRKLTPEEVQTYVVQPRADVPEETGLKRVIMLTLMSPQFLYRETGIGPFNSYSTASWLSYTMWDSIPDKKLLEAAAGDKLQTEQQIRAEVNRMASDLRTKAKLTEFFRQWLKLDHFPEISKNQSTLPGFDGQLVSDLRTSLDITLEEFLASPESDFRKLLVDETLYLNGTLAQFYGGELPPDAPFQKTVLKDQNRAGVLTHPLLLSGFAYDAESSPIHRGVFVARSLLGRRLKPPPEAVSPLAPDLHAGLTTRERVILQTSPNACMTCHVMINDLGFPLEEFDAGGRYRKEDRNQSIDVTGGYFDREGTQVKFAGARGMAEFLANSPEVHEAFVEQLFHYLVKQPVRAFGPDRLQELTRSFAQNQFNVHKLAKEIVVTSALGVQKSKIASTNAASGSEKNMAATVPESPRTASGK